MNKQQWLVEPLPSDVKQSLARLADAEDVQRLAVMPDVHLSAEVCVGVVLATRDLLYPQAVGGDIGCGMAAVRVAASADLLADENNAARVLTGLYRQVPAHRHRGGELPARLHALPLSDPKLERLKQREGRVQLGTLGRGNHFFEFQSDDEGALWLMVHSGSRAMGQAITQHHLQHATRVGHGLLALDARTAVGGAYLADLVWALDYAAANRRAMLRAVDLLLQEQFQVELEWSTLVDAHHNHVRFEQHDGEQLLVHRKGAQSAQLDEPGVLPGSMGTASFHVLGRGCSAALCSSAHGAGRKLRRGEAQRRITARQLQQELAHVWFDERRADQLRDEAPGAYKDIHAVLRAQRELTRVVRELRPLLSYKGL